MKQFIFTCTCNRISTNHEHFNKASVRRIEPMHANQVTLPSIKNDSQMVYYRKFVTICVAAALLLDSAAALSDESPVEKDVTPTFNTMQSGSSFGSVKFLAVDDAFQLSGWLSGDNELSLIWAIAPKYYLYQNRMNIKVLTHGENFTPTSFDLPEGRPKNDPYFGKVNIFYNSVSMKIAPENLLMQQSAALPQEQTAAILEVHYQGCADAGLCYPPQKRYITISGNTVDISSESPSSKL